MTAVGRLDWRGLNWKQGIQKGLSEMIKTSNKKEWKQALVVRNKIIESGQRESRMLPRLHALDIWGNNHSLS